MFIRTDQRGHRWSRLVVAPLGAVALAGLAACSTGADASAASTGGAPTTASAGADPAGDSAMSAYRNCLEQNGVTLPSRGNRPPGGDGGAPPSGAPGAPGDAGGQARQGGGVRHAPPGVDEATWTKAQEACADLRPARPTDAPAAGSAS